MMERKNVWLTYGDAQERECLDLAEDYRRFLDRGKTERECIDYFVNEAEKAGYRELNTLIRKGERLEPGDCVYRVWMNKTMILLRIGEQPPEQGMNILGAHIDSPRLDVKQNPLYEDSSLCYLDTHYYGAIKKYQYVTLPLALHGVAVRKNGETVIFSVGEDEDDPVFFIPDLLIHLAQDQLAKTADKAVNGEDLDLVFGSRPLKIEGENTDRKDPVTAAILEILSRDYGISEEDFISAELEIVPAGHARDAGLDRSMILGYGHDDRACAWPSFRAQLEVTDSPRTTCTLLTDKEEIGSIGATGMQSRFFENTIAEVLQLCGGYSELALRRTLENSCMLSSDVSAAYDPLYAAAFDRRNAAFLGSGLILNKYMGAGGKMMSNDANAEYIAHLREIFDRGGVHTQMAELSRVDQGGGGTIAYILALYGMNVIDTGVPVLSIHSPWETLSKADLYEAWRGYKVFLREASLRND